MNNTVELEHFDIFAFEESVRRKNPLHLRCAKVKEDMEVICIKYFFDGLNYGLTLSQCVMVVAKSVNSLFAPKVYDGNGHLIIEDGSAFDVNWESDSEDDVSKDDNDIFIQCVIDVFTDWKMRKSMSFSTDTFNLMHYKNELAKYNDSFEFNHIKCWNDNNIDEEFVFPDTLSINANALYCYIRKLMIDAYSDELKCKSEREEDIKIASIIQSKKIEAYYDVLTFFGVYFKDKFKGVLNAYLAGHKEDKDSSKCSNKSDNVTNAYYYDDVKKYDNDKVTMMAADGIMYEGVDPSVKFNN